ncbi:MAG: lasso peptide biosynthesis B2 protein, partial [Candidatus Binataceae bacterium]
WAVEAMGRAIPGMKNCLVQAIAAEAMLIRAGHPCEFRIGAAKTGPRELIAHAWLESKGKVLIGEFELDRYTPLVAPDLEGGARPARH